MPLPDASGHPIGSVPMPAHVVRAGRSGINDSRGLGLQLGDIGKAGGGALAVAAGLGVCPVIEGRLGSGLSGAQLGAQPGDLGASLPDPLEQVADVNDLVSDRVLYAAHAAPPNIARKSRHSRALMPTSSAVVGRPDIMRRIASISMRLMLWPSSR
jgi:hypothetical protein